ncbi:MAG: sulfurtransferase TusA family protein [Smithellaceae bacterium]
MIEIDVRGLDCPIPVVRTKQIMENHSSETIAVLGETAVAQENISRLAKMKKYSIACEKTIGEEYKLILTPCLK